MRGFCLPSGVFAGPLVCARCVACGADPRVQSRVPVVERTGLLPGALSRWAWHGEGMARIRLGTAVGASRLEHARTVRSGTAAAALADEALAALACHRWAQVDADYAAYDAHPLDEPDEWRDLASSRLAVAKSWVIARIRQVAVACLQVKAGNVFADFGIVRSPVGSAATTGPMVSER